MTYPNEQLQPVRSPMPGLSMASLISAAVMLLLAACGSVPDEEAKIRRGDGLGRFIGKQADTEPGQTQRLSGPPASSFVGQSVAALDRALGKPALTRVEGTNEFRRYDLERCRVLAVVVPVGGKVTTLTTGAVVSGSAAPTFETCTANL
ncbi:MAG: hypothetical protein AAGG79_04150 [Pseudomonadota bacterium]